VLEERAPGDRVMVCSSLLEFCVALVFGVRKMGRIMRDA
jgi:hypothetical protein